VIVQVKRKEGMKKLAFFLFEQYLALFRKRYLTVNEYLSNGTR